MYISIYMCIFIHISICMYLNVHIYTDLYMYTQNRGRANTRENEEKKNVYTLI